MTDQFEAAGDLASWPRNEPSKPTQAAVFGVFHPTRKETFEMLWTGQFPDLEKAMYWTAKKEMEGVRKGKWIMASRILWQHGITPDEALAAVRQQMEPQINRAMRNYQTGGNPFDIGPGPMRPVDARDPRVTKLVELIPPDGDDPIASFVIPAEPTDGADDGARPR